MVSDFHPVWQLLTATRAEIYFHSKFTTVAYYKLGRGKHNFFPKYLAASSSFEPMYQTPDAASEFPKLTPFQPSLVHMYTRVYVAGLLSKMSFEEEEEETEELNQVPEQSSRPLKEQQEVTTTDTSYADEKATADASDQHQQVDDPGEERVSAPPFNDLKKKVLSSTYQRHNRSSSEVLSKAMRPVPQESSISSTSVSSSEEGDYYQTGARAALPAKLRSRLKNQSNLKSVKSIDGGSFDEDAKITSSQDSIASFATLMFARDAPKIKAAELLSIPLHAPAATTTTTTTTMTVNTRNTTVMTTKAAARMESKQQETFSGNCRTALERRRKKKQMCAATSGASYNHYYSPSSSSDTMVESNNGRMVTNLVEQQHSGLYERKRKEAGRFRPRRKSTFAVMERLPLDSLLATDENMLKDRRYSDMASLGVDRAQANIPLQQQQEPFRTNRCAPLRKQYSMFIDNSTQPMTNSHLLQQPSLPPTSTSSRTITGPTSSRLQVPSQFLAGSSSSTPITVRQTPAATFQSLPTSVPPARPPSAYLQVPSLLGSPLVRPTYVAQGTCSIMRASSDLVESNARMRARLFKRQTSFDRSSRHFDGEDSCSSSSSKNEGLSSNDYDVKKPPSPLQPTEKISQSCDIPEVGVSCAGDNRTTDRSDIRPRAYSDALTKPAKMTKENLVIKMTRSPGSLPSESRGTKVTDL